MNNSNEIKTCERCGLKYSNKNHICLVLEEKEESILIEANKIVNGDRNVQYGDPNQAFEEYSNILKVTFGIELTPIQICKVQMAIKLGRLKYNHKRDSIVDLCGYSEILNRLEK